AAARAYSSDGDAHQAKAAVERAWIATIVLAALFTLSSIVLPMVDDVPAWRAGVLLVRSAGPLCWATVWLCFAVLAPSAATSAREGTLSFATDETRRTRG